MSEAFHPAFIHRHRFAFAILLSLVSSWTFAQEASRSPVASESSNRRPVKLDSSRSNHVTGQASDASSSDSRSSRAGGAAQADFDSLIELIQATIAPDDWVDVGGEATIQGFPGGVYVDAHGMLATVRPQAAKKLAPRWLEQAHQQPLSLDEPDCRRSTAHRSVSLLLLSREWSRLHNEGRAPSVVMQYLAGLERIDYVRIEPNSGDIILVGPAGAWTLDERGRPVSEQTGRPVLQLDDAIVILNNMLTGSRQLVCAITPTQEGLARARAFAIQRADKPVPTRQRSQWLDELRDALGPQRIDVWGIGADTRVARVLVEADHHMKQIGIGIEPGTEQVPSYLERIAESGEIPEQVDVLRWWFTLHPESLVPLATPGTFQLGSQVLRVLSENEWLSERGERMATGSSEPFNAAFARDFTRNITALSRIYPIYADLDNLFRLALVAALVESQVDEHPASAREIREWVQKAEPTVARQRIPRTVESIVNAQNVNKRRFVAAVSGGVRFDGAMAERFVNARPVNIAGPPAIRSAGKRWWWDADRPADHQPDARSLPPAASSRSVLDRRAKTTAGR